MTSPEHYSMALHSAFAELSEDPNGLNWANQPGDRLGPPLRRKRHKLKMLILTGGLAGAGWAYFDSQSTHLMWTKMSTLANQVTSSLLPRPQSASELPAGSGATPPPEIAQPISTETAQAPLASAMPPAATAEPVPETPEDVSKSTEGGATEAPPPLPSVVSAAPMSPPADALPAPAEMLEPYQKRAVAAGLHPSLSRVLLENLSPLDFKNASIAIDNALTARSDDAVSIWPKHAKQGLAIFQVHFVAGAAPGCRRYVVTVSKEGWATTALPVEKCGMAGAGEKAVAGKR